MRAIAAEDFAEIVFISRRNSGALSILPCQRYTESMGPTMFTQAANFSSTSDWAIRDASSFEPAVLMRSFSSAILLQSLVSVTSARAKATAKHDGDYTDPSGTDCTDQLGWLEYAACSFMFENSN